MVAHAAMSPLPVNPTMHVQAVAAVLATGEFALPGHVKQADSTVAPGAEVVPAGQARQSDVRFTQLFSCADAWAKTSFDRCVFQIYSFDSCQSLELP